MQVVLLEKLQGLGKLGEVVNVKDGFARNFLLPQKKALRATKSNLAFFEAEKAKLQKLDGEKKVAAEKTSKKLNGKTVAIIRAASEAGQLFGSVSTRDIAVAVSTLGETVEKSQVQINQSFKNLGLFPVQIVLHGEVETVVTINIARSEDEAKIQEKEGRALITVLGNNSSDEDDYAVEAKTEEKADVAEASETEEKAEKKASKKAKASKETSEEA